MTTRTTLLAALLLTLAPLQAVAGPTTLPVLEATTLDGVTRSVPGDLVGELNLLLVAFEKRHEQDSHTWTEAAIELAMEYPDFTLYGVPVLPASMGWLRPIVLAFLDARYDHPVQRAQILLTFTNPKDFRETVGIDDPDQIHALLVDKHGQILWRSEGVWTPRADAGLRSVLEDRMPSRVADAR